MILKKYGCILKFNGFMENNETYLSHFLSIFEAKIMEYFQGTHDHFLVPGTEVPETLRLVFSMELLAISSMSEVGSEHTVCFGASFRLTKSF